MTIYIILFQYRSIKLFKGICTIRLKENQPSLAVENFIVQSCRLDKVHDDQMSLNIIESETQ